MERILTGRPSRTPWPRGPTLYTGVASAAASAARLQRRCKARGADESGGGRSSPL